MKQRFALIAAVLFAPRRLRLGAATEPPMRFGLWALVVYAVAAQLDALAEGVAVASASADLAGLLMMVQTLAFAVLPFGATWLVIEYVLTREQQAWRGLLMWPFVVAASVGHTAATFDLLPAMARTWMHAPDAVGALWSMFASWRVRAASEESSELPSSSRAVAVLGAVALLVTGVVGALSVHDVWSRRHELGPTGTGETLGAFSVPILAGQTFTERDLEGQVTLLAFWATYCGPCAAEMPTLNAVSDRYADSDVRVIGVNQDFDEDQPTITRHYRRLHKLRFPIVLDDGQLARMLRVTRIPHLVLVDRQGVVRRVFQGQVGEDKLVEALEAVRAG